MQDFSFYIVTDTHLFDNRLGASGPAYEARSRTDQKCVAETEAIIDAGFAQLAQDKKTDTVIIPGDLVYRAERPATCFLLKSCANWRRAAKKSLSLRPHTTMTTTRAGLSAMRPYR